MTTENQNRWAQHLESASSREIRQMAEWATDHIDALSELSTLQVYLIKSIKYLKAGDQQTIAKKSNDSLLKTA